MTKPKLQAYVVAALFSDGQDHFLAVSPYVAASQDLATASVVAYVMSDSRTTLPLQMVNTVPLSVEWLRGALQHIEASEAPEEKPKVIHLVPPAPPEDDFLPDDGSRDHSLSCPKRWGGWGHCRCGAA